MKTKSFTDEEDLLAIVDSIPDGLIAVDTHLRVMFFNRAAERITGISRSVALGKTSPAIFNITPSECPLNRALQTAAPMVNQYLCVTDASGLRTPLSVSTALLRDRKGQITGATETFRNLNGVEVSRRKLSSDYFFSDMIGRSQVMRELFDMIPEVARSDSTVLITGESGTGKELVARAIHNASRRKAMPLVSVNTNAIPDSLCESELFGYRAGAFTDAKTDKKGRFALANKGTIFLDEIGYMSQTLQVKLLRVLQEHVYEPLGSAESDKTDVRIIAATNRDLEKLVKDGEFRNDLYYRLNVFQISLPPLRERLEDVPLLVSHFIKRFAPLKQKDITSISPNALKILMNYDYPGNVRELENIIEHTFILCLGGEITEAHLPKHLLNSQNEDVFNPPRSIDDLEAGFLLAALKRNLYNRHETARELGISAATLYRKIKKLNIPCPNLDGRSHHRPS